MRRATGIWQLFKGGVGRGRKGVGEMVREEEVGERQVASCTRHLPLPYLLLPPPPSLGPATVARRLPSYAPNGAERL
ncbi:hypothetical protein PPACK8108_LOCUS4533 [Phakopsora pachyrhizi]|uniref:Uncharacterized protein n=1 Tax=Phakopsora pachyrhizi TaxID=170000 RepID=A0AAV0AR32_PHAPC|nr:hypothetical protein PPACK8108_LOCUS4533 [Phakopsora pachyrhizi]